jgi:hypothetical protein
MKFRKKPVVIEALEWDLTPETLEKLRELGAESSIMSYSTSPSGRIITGLRIKTLEGTMNCSDGDWIIKGVNGEFYPCKPSSFEKSYERVEE